MGVLVPPHNDSGPISPFPHLALSLSTRPPLFKEIQILRRHLVDLRSQGPPVTNM